MKTNINWNEEKIKNNNNIKVLTRTTFDILFKNTTCIKEFEHRFPSENPIKMGGGGVGCLCKIIIPLVQEKAHVPVWINLRSGAFFFFSRDIEG